MDFDLHGIVGIRLVNPRKSDTDFLNEKLGKFRKTLLPFETVPEHYSGF